MEKKQDYIDHIKERWSFAKQVSETDLKLSNHTATNVALSIFDKVVSPYHYFIQDTGTTTGSDDPPTQKQIAYAKKLNIQNPESYTKKELSKKIDEVR